MDASLCRITLSLIIWRWVKFLNHCMYIIMYLILAMTVYIR